MDPLDYVPICEDCRRDGRKTRLTREDYLRGDDLCAGHYEQRLHAARVRDKIHEPKYPGPVPRMAPEVAAMYEAPDRNEMAESVGKAWAEVQNIRRRR